MGSRSRGPLGTGQSGGGGGNTLQIKLPLRKSCERAADRDRHGGVRLWGGYLNQLQSYPFHHPLLAKLTFRKGYTHVKSCKQGIVYIIVNISISV